jgi:hypothetical protein
METTHIPSVGRVMKVDSRWFTPGGMVVITEVHEQTREVSFEHLTTREKGKLYAAHLYTDNECVRKFFELRDAKNEKSKMIGLANKRRGTGARQ